MRADILVTDSQTMRKKKLVWDLPVRLFHWALVLLFGAAWITAEQGPAWMDRHMQIGYAIMTLALFRLLWGFFGSHQARFSTFFSGPKKALVYIKNLRSGSTQANVGHNPLGGWSVVAMLLLLLFQASTGLFANDDIYNDGPLTSWVSSATSGLLTKIHKLNFNLLLVLTGTHIVAVFGYLLIKKDNLIKPMFTGQKELGPQQAPGRIVSTWRALAILLCCAGAVYLLVD